VASAGPRVTTRWTRWWSGSLMVGLPHLPGPPEMRGAALGALLSHPLVQKRGPRPDPTRPDMEGSVCSCPARPTRPLRPSRRPFRHQVARLWWRRSGRLFLGRIPVAQRPAGTTVYGEAPALYGIVCSRSVRQRRVAQGLSFIGWGGAAVRRGRIGPHSASSSVALAVALRLKGRWARRRVLYPLADSANSAKAR
jgi:hypothetical protein